MWKDREGQREKERGRLKSGARASKLSLPEIMASKACLSNGRWWGYLLCL